MEWGNYLFPGGSIRYLKSLWYYNKEYKEKKKLKENKKRKELAPKVTWLKKFIPPKVTTIKQLLCESKYFNEKSIHRIILHVCLIIQLHRIYQGLNLNYCFAYIPKWESFWSRRKSMSWKCSRILKVVIMELLIFIIIDEWSLTVLWEIWLYMLWCFNFTLAIPFCDYGFLNCYLLL